MQRVSSISQDQLDEWEHHLIHFIYQSQWKQAWDEVSIPKDLFKSWCAHAKRLSDSFTLDRSKLAPNYFNQKEARYSYLLYFHLANVVRLTAILEDYRDKVLKPTLVGNLKKHLRVLDIGCGWGATAWALHWVFKDEPITIDLVMTDTNRQVLSQGTSLLKRMHFKNIRVQSEVLEIGDNRGVKHLASEEKFDLVTMANALNEVDEHGQKYITPFVKKLWFYGMKEDAALLTVEPALKELSQNLSKYRDEWIECLHAFAPLPCMHQAACPMNEDPEDWCHFETQWKAPSYRTRMEKFLQHRGTSLKASYFLLTKNPVGLKKENEHRVLSDELKLKHGPSLILCTPEGKLGVVLGKDKKRKRIHRGEIFPLNEGHECFQKEAPKPAGLSDEEFVRQFEDLSLDEALFNHKGHLRLAWLYMSENDYEAAREKLCQSIKAYAESKGATEKFHHTLTMALGELVHERMKEEDNFKSFLYKNKDLMKYAKELISEKYSSELLASKAARESFVKPDLA